MFLADAADARLEHQRNEAPERPHQRLGQARDQVVQHRRGTGHPRQDGVDDQERGGSDGEVAGVRRHNLRGKCEYRQG